MKALLAVAITATLVGCSSVAAQSAHADPGTQVNPAAPLPGTAGPTPLQQWIDNTVPALPHPGEDQLTALWRGVLSPPTGDPIFDAWPADLAAAQPGQILATRDVTATTAPLVAVPIQRAVLLKFRTTSATGTPSFGTATLIVPAAAWNGPGTRPVQVNALPINSLGAHCTTSYTMAHGIFDKPNTDLAVFLPTVWSALNQGFAVVLPDHEGPRMAYAEPNIAGHVMLDSIRAVRNNAPAEFGGSRFTVNGYSGGAIAAYAAAMLMNEYAPDLKNILVGAAAGGLVTDYRDVAHRFNGNIESGILLSVVMAMTREHPDMLQYMNHLAQWVSTSPIKDICGDADGPLGVAGFPIDIAANIGDPLNSPYAEKMYAQLDLTNRKSAVPLYIYHGGLDWWLPIEDAQKMYEQQCAKGVPAVFRNVPGEHLIGFLTGYPGLNDWLSARLRGEPAPDECTAH